MWNIIGAVLTIGGIMAVAGSANDCDGACMEYANTFGEMITVMIFGLTAMIVGGIILYNENN